MSNTKVVLVVVPSFASDWKVTSVAPNPKVPNTASEVYYKLYKVGMTLAEFAAAMKAKGVTKSPAACVRFDAARGFITLESPKA